VAVVEAVPVAAAPAAAPKAKSGGGGLSYTERKEMNRLEKEIEKLGTQIASYEDKLARCTEGYSVLAELTAEMNKLVLQLAAKEERWVELADMDAVGADA